MPQASDELRLKMQEYFGPDGLDSNYARSFLDPIVDEYGGHLTIKETAQLTSKHINCLNFLVEEWDYSWKWEGVV